MGGDGESAVPLAVVDIDGVVADVRHRLRHVERRPKNWTAFFAAAPRDPLLAEGAAVVRRLAEDHEIIWLTGRPAMCRRETLHWLRQHRLPEGRLIMRASGDFRPARETKVERLRELAQARPVDVLVDDDDEVVRAAREAGFPVLHATWMTDEAAPAAGRTGGMRGGRRPDASAVLRQAQERDGRT